MATLGQAIERQRESGGLPVEEPVSLRSLSQRFRATTPVSIRSLMSSMFGAVAKKMPWAIILCRFKGLQGDSSIESLMRDIFTPGTGGMIEYWRDVSLGAIDITGSRVMGWTELEISRESAGGVQRGTLIDYALKAARRDGLDPVTGFHSQVAVFTHDWSKDGAPPGADWRDPTWAPFWIDGSADGQGRVSLPPHLQNGNALAHEMGHGFGMGHDIGADLVTHYADPCCIMSQNTPFIHPRWGVAFGPTICLPHLIQRNWMYSRRVYFDKGDWMNQPEGITVPLAPISRPGARANLGIRLAYAQGDKKWDYFLEYVTPTDWNKGVPGAPLLFIRRIAPVTGQGDSPVYLGYIAINSNTEFVEPSGNVKFRAELTQLSGPIVRVNIRKL